VTLQKDSKTNSTVSLEIDFFLRTLVKANMLSKTIEGDIGGGGTGGVKNTVTKSKLLTPSITK
jgi:hypothetical protein